MDVTPAAIKACPTAFASVAAECGMQPPASLRRQRPITSFSFRGPFWHLYDTLPHSTAQDTIQTQSSRRSLPLTPATEFVVMCSFDRKFTEMTRTKACQQARTQNQSKVVVEESHNHEISILVTRTHWGIRVQSRLAKPNRASPFPCAILRRTCQCLAAKGQTRCITPTLETQSHSILHSARCKSWCRW